MRIYTIIITTIFLILSAVSVLLFFFGLTDQDALILTKIALPTLFYTVLSFIALNTILQGSWTPFAIFIVRTMTVINICILCISFVTFIISLYNDSLELTRVSTPIWILSLSFIISAIDSKYLN
jgi:hypothetical protein